MVDAANRGWRDNSGVLTKQIVIDRILPPLNSKFKCNKTYSNYQSRLKWFKGRYTFYSTLLNFSSGFGYDSTSKKFTAPNEVWDEYIKAHPKDGYMRYEAFDDYEDLKIAVGNGVAVGKNSIGLGSSTEARTLEAGEMRDLRIEDLAFDVDSEVFVLEQNDPSPKGSPEVFEVPRKKLPTKRGRVDYEGSSDSSANPPKSDIFQQLAKLTSTFEGVYGLFYAMDTEKILENKIDEEEFEEEIENEFYDTQRFGRSHFTASRNFNKVLKALNTIAPQMMVKPGGISPKISETTVKGRDVSSYRNRHRINSQNVLAACNFDLEFIYVLSGWEGSAHDAKLLNDALSRRNGLEVPQGKYYLVDYGFANRRQTLAPIRNVRYHLKDFGGQGRHPRNANELFNLRHSSLRNIQAELVLACVGIHNFLRKECRSDEFPIEVEDVQPSDMDDGGNDGSNFSSQQQQRAEANTWRANIANSMWNDRLRQMKTMMMINIMRTRNTWMTRTR
ncbi:hypothetical protein POM88_001191 [Heracleum sosnowskyi]|uniref:Transposase n=1 Tax=Heracleum sosnowskyi TaxID=360622 RepID=A0AAD8JD79_9APIA|nr:hypothetical protein POM88_001191 [Heracleum sosnowskyi]